MSKRSASRARGTASGKGASAPTATVLPAAEPQVLAVATPLAVLAGTPVVEESASPARPALAPDVAEPSGHQPAGGGPQQTPGIAESPPGAQSGRVEEFLGFRLDSEEYCVWIRSIKEIIRPPEITPIPRSPANILGLISLRGTIVPIFNIRRRLGLPTSDMGPKARIVVVVLEAGPVGMMVDQVTEVISVDPGVLEPPPPTMGEREASLVTATVRLHDRIVGVLHLERLVAIETETPLRAAA